MNCKIIGIGGAGLNMINAEMAVEMLLVMC